MEIAFISLELRSLCEDKELAISCLGEVVGERLVNRLADIMAADTIVDLPWKLPHLNKCDHPSPILVLSLSDTFKIGLCANHVDNIKNIDKEVHWNQVKKIKLLYLD